MSSVITETQTLQRKVAQTLQDFWELYTGVRPGRAAVIIDRQAIVALLEEVLAPAEQKLVHSETGRLTLQKVGERILKQAKPHLLQAVSEAVGQEVSLVVFNLDVTTGSILIFFQCPVGIFSESTAG
jgi:uncharacterized protein YbcI